MKINELSQANWLKIGGQESKQYPEVSFSSYLKDALNQVGSLENQAHNAAADLAIGDASQIHQVMIAYEKASLALSLTVEIRNRVVEAYQEIMRIQM